jgi:hypothetical protein
MGRFPNRQSARKFSINRGWAHLGAESLAILAALINPVVLTISKIVTGSLSVS